ncbi:Altered inheritance of mitochondria protein 24, mitochondrial [Zalaria obscura]|uniref:Altered inheritance of mitochondria protein 24, mitochondrial n=1 Tax=Zalaria obscura TaxID=2024903 RepID=A0ACC3SCU3_9PEZI
MPSDQRDSLLQPTEPQPEHPGPFNAQFEVIGSPFSLLSASISASQNLYTRKGTLVGFNGKAENAVSTLSVLEPFRRAFFGIPFLYQKVSSTTPFTALISTKSALTTFAVVHLDGRLDWMVAQRNALLAWTGHTLSIKPQLNTQLSVAHWGNSRVTGRGLLCLSGQGQVYQVSLKTGEEYVVHPSNVIAYSIMQHAPQPYRFRSSILRFQIPSPASLLPDTRFFRLVRESQAWRFFAGFLFTARTWARRSIWGDRLFLRFEGPANILIQSRGSRITESLSSRDINEIADSPAGAVQSASAAPPKLAGPDAAGAPPTPSVKPTKVSFATVGQDGKVEFQKSS